MIIRNRVRFIVFQRAKGPEEGDAYRKKKEWLQGKANGEQNHLWNEYLKARAAYSKACSEKG